MSMNKVILIGNLGKEPELTYTQEGTARARFSIATSEAWTGQDGQKRERTEWHNIVLWGKTAEIAYKYLTKGREVCIEGRLQTRSWEKDGVTRYSTEVVGDRLVLLRGAGRGADGAPGPDAPERFQGDGTPAAAVGGHGADSAGKSAPPDDDIPF